MKSKNIYIWILSALVIILVVIVSFLLLKGKLNSKIDSFQDCVDAGNPVQESYPERCVTPDGKSFTNPDQKVDEDDSSNNDNEQPQQTEVKVYFSKGLDNPEDMSFVTRTTDREDVGTFAIEQLIAGPTEAEKQQGILTPLAFTGDYSCTDKNELLPKDFKLDINETSKKATVQFCRQIKDSGVGTDARITNTVRETLEQFETIDKVVILDKNDNCFGDLSGLNLCKE